MYLCLSKLTNGHFLFLRVIVCAEEPVLVLQNAPLSSPFHFKYFN